ncbi:hypothetical protein Y1Q_0019668 [Alligator mississippiensis]|uniref:Uncharacterized protein n=1 Tax=Alligator mississippiensis TaxID=8496 RepID=A0A151PEY5_ALLMI|nr:hypothetical protein Y1Q_0019668 [Alligator mississippiensis]
MSVSPDTIRQWISRQFEISQNPLDLETDRNCSAFVHATRDAGSRMVTWTPAEHQRHVHRRYQWHEDQSGPLLWAVGMDRLLTAQPRCAVALK